MATFHRKANLVIDRARFEILAQAMEGNFSPLANYIESGDTLTPELRGITVSALRGSIKKPPHRRRTLTNVLKERGALAEIYQIAMRAKDAGHKVNKSRAVELYLDLNPDVTRATLLKWIENWEVETNQNFTALLRR